MKAVKAKVTRGLPTGARLRCVDNTGAKELEIISVLGHGGTRRRYLAAGVGDMILASVKKGSPETRGKIVNAVIVRQRKEYRRRNGMRVRFEDNAAIITDKEGNPSGTETKGPVAMEATRRFTKIAPTISQII